MSTGPSPVDTADRIGELDILRGFALLGVFIVHFTGAAFYALPLDEAVAEAWSSQADNATALFITEWLFYDKANTLFATLFGMGFWVMMERLEARGGDFATIYLRRLFLLLLIGLVNIALIFPGDVLHEYALLGFALFLLRRLPPAAMLWIGLPLVFFGTFIGSHIEMALGLSYGWVDAEQAEVFAVGTYSAWAGWHMPAHVTRDIVQFGLTGWALHIFGRFLIGAWIIRQGLLLRMGERLPAIRRLFAIALPLGLLLELGSMLIYTEVLNLPGWLDQLLHGLGAPTLALGYALGLILLYQAKGRAIAAFFAPVGRTALTAYVVHGAIYTWLYFPFGLDMLGIIPPIAGFLLALVVFAVFTLIANWWLARYRYGPLEYLWRWGTYGKRPGFRLQPA